METSTLKDVTFLTAADVAEILKLHPQVVTRKLQSGEIPGYKLGKDWRISDRELAKWLESRSNQKRISEREKVERTFFKEGKLTDIPAQRKKRRFILEKLLDQFETDRVYTEAQVNAILRRFHSDVCTLRREFIMEKMMVRASGKYHRVSSYQSKSS